MSQLRKQPVKWDFLAGFLPYGIEPMDIDLCIERRGHFLILEGKRPLEEMPKGQKRCLDALNRLPQFTVVRIEGNPPDEVTAYARWGSDVKELTTTEGFKDLVYRWFESVERRAA